MNSSRFILHETFQSQTDEQRKERFQQEFERYLLGALASTDPTPTHA